jgi:inosose dehydratase
VKLAFSIPTQSASEEATLFKSYKTTGYDGLQLKSGQYLKYLDDPGKAEAIARDDPGRFSGLIFGGPLDDEGQDALRHVVRFAAAVFSERVIFCHQHSRDRLGHDDVRSFAQTLSHIGRYSLDLGVKLSLHHHYDQPVMFPREIEIFFDAVAPGTVGLTLDTAHMWKSGEDNVGPVIKRFSDVLDNVHLKDCRDDANGRRLPNGAREAASFMPLGKGEIDFQPIFTALSEIGYSGWLCVDEESGASVGEALQASRDFIFEHLSKAGRTSSVIESSKED